MGSNIVGRAAVRIRPARAYGWSTGGRRRLLRALAVASALLTCALAWILLTADNTVTPSHPAPTLSNERTPRVPATPSRGAMGASLPEGSAGTRP